VDRVIIEKVIITQLLKTFPEFHGTRKFQTLI